MGKEYSLDLLGKEYSLEFGFLFWINLGKEYSLEYWIFILRKFGKRIFFRFRYVRFIRNGDFFDKEIDNGNFIIQMFLIKDKLIFKCYLNNGNY